MINLTKEERLVLIVLGFIFFLGAVLHFTLKINPRLWNLINFAESDKLYQKIDINTASHQELVRVPYIGDVTAKRIIAYRTDNGAFESIAQIKSIPGVRQSQYDIISKYLKVSRERDNK